MDAREDLKALLDHDQLRGLDDFSTYMAVLGFVTGKLFPGHSKSAAQAFACGTFLATGGDEARPKEQ